MTELVVGAGLRYLVTTSKAWRHMDWQARAIVRGMKREKFDGYCYFRIRGQDKRFDSSNIEELIPLFFGAVARWARQEFKGQFSVVPIPNSNMTLGAKGTFRCVELANMLSEFWPEVVVEPVLRWDKPRPKQHKTPGFRRPSMFEPFLRLIGRPTRPVLLFDDLLTSGSQMIAAARVLRGHGHLPAYGLVGGQVAYQQQPRMLGWSLSAVELDELDLAEFS